MQYHKLVRDNIPKKIESNGEKATYHTATDAEYWSKLKEKLLEEVSEFNQAESTEELADILEVIEAIIEYKKFDQNIIAQLKANKAEKNGKFKDKIILDEA